VNFHKAVYILFYKRRGNVSSRGDFEYNDGESDSDDSTNERFSDNGDNDHDDKRDERFSDTGDNEDNGDNDKDANASNASIQPVRENTTGRNNNNHDIQPQTSPTQPNGANRSR
jgi:hypothetical protein